MKLKYYLRGLGIGIAVTAVILSVSAKEKPQAMTDAQIVAKAKELGMVEQTVLSELAAQEEAEDGQSGADAAETESAQAEAESGGSTQQEAESDGNSQQETEAESGGSAQQETEGQNADSKGVKPETDTKDSDKEEAVTGQNAAGLEEESLKAEMESSVIVSIYPGEGSYTVSRKLAALGLVESADVYDKFLCQNGYDKKLCTGNYEIKAGAGADEIAKILTKRK